MAKPKAPKPQVVDKVVYVKDHTGQPHAVKFNDASRMHPALKEYLCYCMFKSANRMRALADECLAPFDLQTIHFGILSVLNRGDVISQIQMGEQLGIDKASMVKLVDRLEALHLVERIPDKDDRRIKLLKITSKGKQTFAQARKRADETEARFLKNLSKEEQAVLRKIIPLLLED